MKHEPPKHVGFQHQTSMKVKAPEPYKLYTPQMNEL